MARVAQPDITSQTISGLMTHWAVTIVGLLAPVLMAAAALAGVAANVIQNKPGFTPAAIRPDFRKISPIGGIKRLVGPQALVEFGEVDLRSWWSSACVAMLVLWPEVDHLVAPRRHVRRARSAPTPPA